MIIREVTKAEVSAELRNRFFGPLDLTGTFLVIEEQVPGEISHGFSDLNGDGRLDDMSAVPRLHFRRFC